MDCPETSEKLMLESAPMRFEHTYVFVNGRWLSRVFFTLGYAASAVIVKPSRDPVVSYVCAVCFCSPKDVYNKRKGRESVRARFADACFTIERSVSDTRSVLQLVLRFLRSLDVSMLKNLRIPQRVIRSLKNTPVVRVPEAPEILEARKAKRQLANARSRAAKTSYAAARARGLSREEAAKFLRLMVKGLNA